MLPEDDGQKMIQSNDAGKLIVRLTVGGLLLFHGVHKVMNIGGTVDGIGSMLAAHNLPAFLAWGVFVGEFIAPLLIIFGLFSRIGGVLVMINILFAVLLAHTAQFFTLTQSGGWALELQAFYFLTALAVVVLGPGKFSVNRY